MMFPIIFNDWFGNLGAYSIAPALSIWIKSSELDSRKQTNENQKYSCIKTQQILLNEIVVGHYIFGDSGNRFFHLHLSIHHF